MDVSNNVPAATNAATTATTNAVQARKAPITAQDDRKSQSEPLKDGDQFELSAQGRQMSSLYANKRIQENPSTGDNGSNSNATASQDAKASSELEQIRQKLLAEMQRDEDDKEVRPAESEYEKARMAKLDHIKLLIDEGKLHVDNFMVDRIAVELARYMQ